MPVSPYAQFEGDLMDPSLWCGTAFTTADLSALLGVKGCAVGADDSNWMQPGACSKQITTGPLVTLPMPANAPVPQPAQRLQLSALLEKRTTVMLRNLPDGMTRGKLLELLDSQGFAGKYDFAYLPVAFDTLAALDHAFVNMVTPEDAQRIRSHFEGFTWGASSTAVCRVVWNDKQQGLPALVERYRNSPVMHESVPDECKPIISTGGRCAPFPPPTHKIKAPKILKGKA